MKENVPVLNLEVEEIETRERTGGCSTSSSTSRLCTCACRYTTTLSAVRIFSGSEVTSTSAVGATCSSAFDTERMLPIP